MIRRTLIMLAVALAAAQAYSEKTVIFTCGTDQVLGAVIPLHWTTLVLAGDGRLYVPCAEGLHTPEHRESRESEVIARGRGSKNPEEQLRAVQATLRSSRAPGYVYGRPFGNLFSPACDAEVHYFGQADSLRRWAPGQVFRLMRNSNVELRKEAAFTLGRQLSQPNLDAEVLVASIRELRVCWLLQSDPEVQGLLLESLGVAQYQDLAQADAAQEFLVKEAQGLTPKILGAVKGLEALFRQNTQLPARDETLVRLRELVVNGVKSGKEAPSLDVVLRIRRLAFMALQAARDADPETIRAAATDPDWQIRRLAAARLNLADGAQGGLVPQLSVDEFFQVRYELVGALGRQATRTHECAPVIAFIKDESPIVAMRAMDALSAECTDLEDVAAFLTAKADALTRSEDGVDWHVPARALAALSRITPEAAKARVAAAATHPVWQVRAAVAAMAQSPADDEVVAELAADPEPNVKTAALQALFRLKHPALVTQAIDALNTGTDYQLLRMAAMVLQGLPAEMKEDATNALLGALRRLTEEETDTSRDPRVAILDRLAETIAPERSSDLLTFVADYDDEVRAAARRAFLAVVRALPADPPKLRRRYPFQPSQSELANLPKEATIRLDQGTVILRLLLDVAPVTVARFAALANSGFYNNRIFHRVVPNFIVQGGSPGGNEYGGTSRFMRDEVGPQATHVRGAVGMSSRGADTGDGQIFIDLVDLPRLDRDYTVFAYVTKGMELVDQLLDGAKILSISVK